MMGYFRNLTTPEKSAKSAHEPMPKHSRKTPLRRAILKGESPKEAKRSSPSFNVAEASIGKRTVEDGLAYAKTRKWIEARTQG